MQSVAKRENRETISEHHLQTDTERYHLLFETMAQGVVYQDADGLITSANPAAERILGLSLEQMQGRDSYDARWQAIHEDGSPFPGDAHPSLVALHTGREVKGVVMGVFNPRRGEYRWINIYAVPLFRRGESEPYQVYTIFDDVTEHKAADEALAKSESRYRNLVENALVGVYRTTLSGEVRYVNRALARMFEFDTPQEMIAQSALAGYTDLAARERLIEQLQSTSQPAYFELDAHTQKGNVIRVLLSANLEGEVLSGMIVDITERRRAEKALERALDETARGQRLLLSLGQAAQAVQRAHSPQEVYKAIGAEIASLGFHSAVVLLDEAQTHLEIVHVAAEPRVVQMLERLLGCPYREYCLPLQPDTQAPETAISGEVLFAESPGRFVDEFLPKNLQPAAQKLASFLGEERYIVAPLKVGSEVYGLLVVGGASLAEEDAAAMSAFANQAAIALHNTLLFEAEREQRSLAEALRDTAETLTSTLEVDEVLDRVLDNARRVLPHDTADILMLGDADEVTFARSRGYVERGLSQWVEDRRMRISDFPSLSQAADSKRAVVIPDTAAYAGWVDIPETAWMRSYICAPIRLQDGLAGFLTLSSTTPGTYHPQHAAQLQAFADQAAIAIENARLFESERIAQEQLRALASHLEAAREEERAHIAREIHDEFGQALTALKLDLAWLARHLPADKDQLAKIDGMSDLIDDTVQTVRRIATELRPGILDDLGLPAAIEWQAEEFARRTGIACQVWLSHEELDLERALATALFRILQEALTNVARHAGATQVTITLEQRAGEVGGELVLAIYDNGRGITESQANNSISLGILGMRERARTWGGTMSLHGPAGQGTQLVVRIPQRRTSGSRA